MFSKTIFRILFFPITLVRAIFCIALNLIGAGLLSGVWYVFVIFILCLVGVNSVDTQTIAILFTVPFFIVASAFFVIFNRDNIFNWVESIN